MRQVDILRVQEAGLVGWPKAGPAGAGTSGQQHYSCQDTIPHFSRSSQLGATHSVTASGRLQPDSTLAYSREYVAEMQQASIFVQYFVQYEPLEASIHIF
jgi:hypothetical protein